MVEFQILENMQDKEILNSINKELDRQKNQIELIASENIVSQAVLQAQGSVLTNKYAEGYPSKRYYGGCEFVDDVEALAIERVKKLFGAKFANVQPHSGASANLAVYLAFLKPGDTIVGMSLDAGGHLTHGANKTISGMWLESHHYGIREDDGLIDYDEMERVVKAKKPKMIIAGISSYPRQVDWGKFRKVADENNALLLVDMAHIAGLVAGVQHSSPIPFADFVTSTTHKTLRGPRGGIILTNNEDYAKKINSAVFPGLQGGPLMHVIAAKAVAFGEALRPEFKLYAQQVVKNAKILADTLIKRGFKVITGGTDNHMMVLDLTTINELTGKEAEKILEKFGLTCNKNAIPNDPRSPFVTSGLRFGTSAITTRGFKEAESEFIGHKICDILENYKKLSEVEFEIFGNKIKDEVFDLCQKFPIY
ncbi:serine hydroxymethyltransferase [Flavobacteriaceae bacterium]|nr:serine hydroxymethyltransferase [Flavobacteriaceae bacterium]